MRRLTFAGTCLLGVALAISGHSVFGQSQQRGGSSSSSSGSYGGSSSSHGSSSTTRSTSSNSYGTSSSSYGTSSSSYGTSGNSYGTSRNTYGSSSGSQSRRSTSSYERSQPRFRDRSVNRLYLPIILAGRVIVEGEEGLPEPVVIRVSCGGGSLPQDYTDRRGRFSFQPSCNPVLAMSDASARWAFFGAPSGSPFDAVRGPWNLSHCWLYAELPGYRSSEIWLGMSRPMRMSRVGTIVLSRIDGASGDPVSLTTLTAPKSARKAYEKGAKLLRSVEEPDYARAIPFLERAVELHPEFAAAWEALGRARAGLGERESAREAFERAVEIDGQFLKPYLALVNMAVEDKDWTELESLTDRYLAMSPGSMKLRLFNSFAALKNGNSSKAKVMAEMIESAGEMDDWPMTYLILAEVYTDSGDFNEAAKLYEAYLSTLPGGQYSEQIKRTLNDWSELRVIEPVGFEISTVSNADHTPVASSTSNEVAP